MDPRIALLGAPSLAFVLAYNAGAQHPDLNFTKFDKWTFACPTQATDKAKHCLIFWKAIGQDDPNTSLTVIFQLNSRDLSAGYMTIVAPLEPTMHRHDRPISLHVYNAPGSIPPKISYLPLNVKEADCSPQSGCSARIILSPRILKELMGGQKLNIIYKSDFAGEDPISFDDFDLVSFNFDMSGFA